MSGKQVEKSEAEQIWEEIKSLPINMFALSNQKVEQHVVKVPMPSRDELLLKLVSTAALPALEETLANKFLTQGRKYEVEVAEGYTIVRRGSQREEEIKKALAPFVVAK